MNRRALVAVGVAVAALVVLGIVATLAGRDDATTRRRRPSPPRAASR